MTQADVRRQQIARERRRRPVSIVALRLAELNRLLTARHAGEVLSDDDAGRDDAMIVAHHLARCSDPTRRIASWIGLRAPWMSRAEVEATIAAAVAKPHRWRADTLARRLGLTATERRRLRITTIGAVDMLKEKRRDRRRQRDLDRKQRNRRAAGNRPRAEYLATRKAAAAATTQPWKAAGMSRAKWYRLQKRGALPETATTSETRSGYSTPSVYAVAAPSLTGTKPH